MNFPQVKNTGLYTGIMPLKSPFLSSSSYFFRSSLITPTQPVSFPARVFINHQEIMYVMQLHSAYGECVGVKGNYVPPCLRSILL